MPTLIMLVAPQSNSPQLVVSVAGQVQRFDLTKAQLSTLHFQAAKILYEWETGTRQDEK